jgi:hypothetical protein
VIQEKLLFNEVDWVAIPADPSVENTVDPSVEV